MRKSWDPVLRTCILRESIGISWKGGSPRGEGAGGGEGEEGPPACREEEKTDFGRVRFLSRTRV